MLGEQVCTRFEPQTFNNVLYGPATCRGQPRLFRVLLWVLGELELLGLQVGLQEQVQACSLLNNSVWPGLQET